MANKKALETADRGQDLHRRVSLGSMRLNETLKPASAAAPLAADGQRLWTRQCSISQILVRC